MYQRRTPTLGPSQFLRDTHNIPSLIPKAATDALANLLKGLPIQAQHNSEHPIAVLTRNLAKAPTAATRGLTNALTQVASPRQLPTTVSAPNNLPPVAGRTTARQVVYPPMAKVATSKPYHR